MWDALLANSSSLGLTSLPAPYEDQKGYLWEYKSKTPLGSKEIMLQLDRFWIDPATINSPNPEILYWSEIIQEILESEQPPKSAGGSIFRTKVTQWNSEPIPDSAFDVPSFCPS